MWDEQKLRSEKQLKKETLGTQGSLTILLERTLNQNPSDLIALHVLKKFAVVVNKKTWGNPRLEERICQIKFVEMRRKKTRKNQGYPGPKFPRITRNPKY